MSEKKLEPKLITVLREGYSFSHFSKDLTAGVIVGIVALPLAIGFTTVIDGRVDKIVENLAIIKPTIMGAVPRIFEKVHSRINEMMVREGGVKKALFDWAGFDIRSESAGFDRRSVIATSTKWVLELGPRPTR